jgi:carboxypeptidase PM20D1
MSQISPGGFENAVIRRFAGTISFPTVSSPGGFSLEPFHRMREYAFSEWRSVFQKLETRILAEASLLLTWRGTDRSLPPFMLTAHQDVVPPGDHGWITGPFEASIRDGRVFGRGTVDYKCGFAGMLEACSVLLSKGFKPRRTVIFAFGHDEEIGGAAGAASITNALLESSVMCSSVLDEGGYIHRGINGSQEAVIAVAEKGYASFRIVALAEQGHSSVPPPQTAIGKLCRAVASLDGVRLEDPPIPGALSEEEGCCTTIAPTVIQGGCKENVLPGRAEAVINTRPAPGSSIERVHARLSAHLEGMDVALELMEGPSLSEPSDVSSVETPDYKSLVRAAETVLPHGVKIRCGVFPAATDSRRYGAVAGETYRFMPVSLGSSGIRMLHSVNESIKVQDYLNCVRFYAEYIRNASAGG